jgi:uncharacterized protein YqjF (DUF2071 family)
MPGAGATLRMTWLDLAFLHWPVPVAAIRPLVPLALDLDTFEGSAWVAVTPFEMRGVKVSGMLAVPTATNFPELNVRTYVRHGDRWGVWFFSLDAASWLAVTGARSVVGLPYFHARMSSVQDGEWVVYDSRRTHGGAAPAEFAARYRPTVRALEHRALLALLRPDGATAAASRHRARTVAAATGGRADPYE